MNCIISGILPHNNQIVIFALYVQAIVISNRENHLIAM